MASSTLDPSGLFLIVKPTNGVAAWPGLVNIWRVVWKGEKRRQKSTEEKVKVRMENFTEALKVTAADVQREQAAVAEQIQALGRNLQRIERDVETAKQEHEAASERLIVASRGSSRRNLELLADKKLDLVSSLLSPLQ